MTTIAHTLVTFQFFIKKEELNKTDILSFTVIPPKFNEILFIDEDTNKAAYFKHQTGTKIKAADHYDKKADTFGLWESQRLASTSVKYQLLICNTSFYSGFMVSGYTNCYKQCGNWCSDTRTPYFRTSSTSGSYSGVAFNTNGHTPIKSPKLMSVGLR